MPKIPKKYLLLLALILFVLFAFYSYRIAKGAFVYTDFNTTVRLQDHLPRKVDGPFTLISLLGSAEVTMSLWAIMIILLLFKRQFWTVVAFFLMPLSIIIELYQKINYFHPAPPHFFYRGIFDFELPSRYYVHTNYSYPSGHVTRLSFLIVFLMIYLFYRHSGVKSYLLQAILFVILVMVCVSRVYLGEHWTSDVIGGLLLGSSFGILAGLTIKRKKSREISSE